MKWAVYEIDEHGRVDMVAVVVDFEEAKDLARALTKNYGVSSEVGRVPDEVYERMETHGQT